MRRRKLMTFALLAAGHFACSGGSPMGPGAAPDPKAPEFSEFELGGPRSRVPPARPDGPANGARPDRVSDQRPAASHVPNSPPAIVVKTQPVAVPGDPYPVVEGPAPLTIRFNLCRSSDPDQDVPDDNPTAGEGDSINWQFHFGDDGTEPFAPDGTFNANFARFCRTEHTYSEGRYVATLSVTDKHLEDQSRLGSLARVTERIAVVATGGQSRGRPERWTWSGVNSFGCNDSDISLGAASSGFTNPPYFQHTIVRSGGLTYMNQVGSFVNTNASGLGWGIFADSTGGPTTGTFPIPAGQQVDIMMLLEQPAGAPIFPLAPRALISLDGCDTGNIVFNGPV
jgi:hypothetical protein